MLSRRSAWPDIAVIGSAAIPSGRVVAIDARTLISSFAGITVDANREATVHFDTSPAQIGVSGTPPTVASPTYSLWQMDSLALRVIMRATWCARVPAAIAWMDGATW